jgi:hypothetical protein
MADFMYAVFQVVAAAIAALVAVVLGVWINLIWPSLTEHPAH